MPASPQMVTVHMSAYGSPGGGQSLAAPLNLAFVNPFNAPTFRQRGVMWVGMATFKAGETAKEGACCANTPPSVSGAEGLDLTSSDS